ncbi:hypothetical protein ABGT23_01650 [Enterobacter cloacae]|uniref:hypothetical protein n=1 Tax=Enterobacter cloacae TaxID=550 RepID=UPI00345D7247
MPAFADLRVLVIPDIRERIQRRQRRFFGRRLINRLLPAIFVTVTDPSDDINSLNDSYNYNSNSCKYGMSAYVILKNGTRVEVSGDFMMSLPWRATGRNEIIAYLQKITIPVWARLPIRGILM